VGRWGSAIADGLDGAAALCSACITLLALPLLVIELPVVIILVAVTLARQRNERSRALRGAA
jgi:hypothetical protein